VHGEIVCKNLGFPEAPRWHDGHLWASDMATGEVLAIDRNGAVESVCSVPGTPSGLGWLPDGRLLVVSMHDRQVLRLEGDRLEVHADVTAFVAADLNDMVVDDTGRAYVTNFGYDAVEETTPVTTGVTLVHPDGRIEPPFGELFRPNGCAITADGATLVVAETRVHRLTTFTIGDQGRLADQMLRGMLPSGTWADGLCLDERDAAWVADPKGKHVFRILADGTVTDTIDTAPLQAIACVLGGDDRCTLFVTLGDIRSWAVMAADRRGQIAAFRVDVPGAGRP
jgi:sugar lactone lactonase YvrE